MALGTDLKLNIIYIHVVRVQICVSNSFIGLWCIVTLMLCFPVLFHVTNCPKQFVVVRTSHLCTCWCCLNWWWFRNVLGVHSSCVVGKIVLGSRLVIALGAWKWLPTPFQSVCLWMLIKSVFALEKFSTGLTFNLLSQLHPVDGCHVPFQGCNSHLFIAHFTISTWNFSLWKCWIQGWGWWV